MYIIILPYTGCSPQFDLPGNIMCKNVTKNLNLMFLILLRSNRTIDLNLYINKKCLYKLKLLSKCLAEKLRTDGTIRLIFFF